MSYQSTVKVNMATSHMNGEAPSVTKLIAIDQAKDLLARCPIGEDYGFYVATGDEEAMIQRMRVEFSRMRKYVRNHGKQVIPFQMKLGYYKPVAPGISIVVLCRTQSDSMAAGEALRDVISQLARPEPPNPANVNKLLNGDN